MLYEMTKDDKTGKYRIKKVPVFGLGEHRGYSYDKDWAERFLFNMGQLAKNKEWYAPFFIGHNSDFFDEHEKPADGFMDNFTVETTGTLGDAGTIFCDLFDVPEESMNDIKSLKFPYRSVEIWSERAYISGMALLGGTEPYFKYPRLEVAEAFGAKPQGKADWHDFKETDSGLEYLSQKNPGKWKKAWEAFKTMWGELTNGDEIDEDAPATFGQDRNPTLHHDTDINAIKDDGKSDDKTNFAGGAGEQQQEVQMPDTKMTPEQHAQFKAEHGMAPEEMAAKYKEQQKQAAADRVTAFKAKLDTYKVLPAIRDEAVKIAEFAKDEASEQALFALIETVLQKAQKNELFAQTDEQTLHNRKTGSPAKYSDDNELFDAIQALMVKENLTFEAAKVKIINQMEG